MGDFSWMVKVNPADEGYELIRNKGKCASCTCLMSLVYKVVYSAANDPRPQMILRPEMIPILENNEWHGFWFLGFFYCLFCSFFLFFFIN